MSKKDAEIYLKAAELVASRPYSSISHWCCCDALSYVGGADIRIKFSALRNPKAGIYDFWFGSTKRTQNRHVRIVALCFAAAMAETGDL